MTRRIRDVSSRKCRDNMMQVAISDDSVTAGPAGIPHLIDATVGYQGLFMASARLPGPQFGAAERTQTRTFAKGYSERVTLITNTPIYWMWRRIVFQKPLKSEIVAGEAAALAAASFWQPGNSFYLRDTTRGQMRPTWNMGTATSPGNEVEEIITNVVFDGTESADWSNVFLAKTSKRFVRVLSDRTRTVGGGESPSGRAYSYRNYYPLNRSIVYDDEEDGVPPDAGSSISDTSRFSSGDLCIYDIFQGINGTGTDTIKFQCEGTYYWHE